MRVQIILFLLGCCLCIQYHLENQNQLSILNTSIVNIVAMKETNKIGILAGNSSSWQLNIVQGPTFSSYKRVTGTNSSSLPIITENQILTNYGDRLSSESVSKTIAVVAGNIFTSKMAVTPTLIVDSQRQACPTLIWIEGYDGIFMGGTRAFENGTNCKFNYVGFAENLGNNLIAYAAKYNIYILTQNLQQLQKIVENGPYLSDGFTQSSSYSSGTSSTLILQGENHFYFAYAKSETSNMFSKQSQFYNPTNSLQLTGVDEGVSFYLSRMYHWRNVKHHVLNLENTDNSQFLGQKDVVGIYYNEKGFVLGDGSNLVFYDFNPVTFNTSKSTSWEFPDSAFEPHSGRVTSDGKYMLGTYRVTYNTQKGVFIYSFQNSQGKTLQSLTDQKYNYSSFGILSNQLFVAVCNTSNSSYSVQLWSFSSMSILSQLQVRNTEKMNPIKIVTNSEWDNFFAVMHKQNYDDSEDNCTTTIYKVTNFVIVDIGVSSQNISFYESYACGIYLVSMKFFSTSSWDLDDSFLKFYSIPDLGEVYRQFYSAAFLKGQLKLYVQRNIVIVQSLPQIGTRDGHIYDLSLAPAQSYVGSYFRQHMYTTNSDLLIFPNLGYLYFYGKFYSSSPYRIVYDLLTPPITSITKIQESNYAAKTYLYIGKADLSLVSDNKCGLAFFILKTTLYKYRDCEQKIPVEQIPLDPTKTLPDFATAQLFFASDKKHILIVYYTSSKYILEIRALDQLHQVAWTTYQNLQKITNADLRANGDIVYTVFNYIKIARFFPSEQPKNYQIEDFRVVQLNTKGCMAFAGRAANDPNVTRVVYKQSRNGSNVIYANITDDNVTLLALHPNCTYLATYQESQIVTVWQILKTELHNFTSYQINGVISMTFTSKNKIVIETKTKIYIMDFLNKDALLEWELSGDSKYGVSKDGQYIAIPVNNNVQIRKLADQSLVATFAVPQSAKITGLAFSSNNSLYISTNQTTLYMLDPTPCPINNIYNNLKCSCPESFDNTEGKCECKIGFIDQQKAQCLPCSFPCETCTGSATSCDSYATGFYLIVILGSVAVLAVIGVGVFCILKKKRKTRALRQREDSNLLTDGQTGSIDN